MKLLLDDAEPERIRQCFECFPLDGITIQNASTETIKKIRDFLGGDRELHVPIEVSRAEDIVVEAERIFDRLGLNTYISIPVTGEGLKAMKILLETSEVCFTASEIHTPMQAVMAGKCGASYVMPFVNRLDSRNAIELVKRMYDALNRNGLETEIIAMHFKTSRQASELCEYGIGAAIPPSMLPSLIANEHDV